MEIHMPSNNTKRNAWLRSVAAGDKVIRLIGGEVPMRLKVTEATEHRIICGPWEFSRVSGAEIDAELTHCASYLREPTEEELKMGADSN